MIFKVGDKVRIVKSTDFPDMVGKVCEVNRTTSPLSSFACGIKQGTFETLVFDWEIEKVNMVGQQLFAFMAEEF